MTRGGEFPRDDTRKYRHPENKRRGATSRSSCQRMVSQGPMTSNKCGTKTPRGTIRTGGGPTKHIAIKNQAPDKHLADHQPVALSKWVDWCGASASDMQNHVTDRLMGGMIANSSRSVYANLFEKWTTRRRVLGMPEYLPTNEDERENNEAAAITYVTPNLGPMGRNASTVQNHRQDIGYFRKSRCGLNPLRGCRDYKTSRNQQCARRGHAKESYT